MPRYRSRSRSLTGSCSSGPYPAWRALVQALGEGLGQAVGQRLGHDGAVVVVVGLEAPRQLVGAEAGRHREGTHVVGRPSRGGSDEVGQGVVGTGRRPWRACWRSVWRVATVSARHPRRREDDVVTVAVGGPEAVHAPRLQQPLGSRCGPEALARRPYTSRARAPTPGRRGCGGRRHAAPTRGRTASSRCSRTISSSGWSSMTRRPRKDGASSAAAIQSGANRLARAAASDTVGRAPALAWCRARTSAYSARSCGGRSRRVARIEQAAHDAHRPRGVRNVHARGFVRAARSGRPCASGWWWRRR